MNKQDNEATMHKVEFLFAAGTSGQHWGEAINCHCTFAEFLDDGGTWRGGDFAAAWEAWVAVGNPMSTK